MPAERYNADTWRKWVPDRGSRISDEQIRRLRELRASGTSQAETARLVGVSEGTVRKYYHA